MYTVTLLINAKMIPNKEKVKCSITTLPTDSKQTDCDRYIEPGELMCNIP